MRETMKPMLAVSGEPFSDYGWIFEVKWDGTRALCYAEEKIRFVNRRDVDITSRYVELQEMREDIHASCVLDGEIVVLRGGKPSFQDLQRREHTDDPFRIKLLSEEIPAVYMAFDLLALEGEDLTRTPLMERRRLLNETVTSSSRVLVCPYVEGVGEAFFEAVVDAGFEGVMAKKMDSLYFPGKRSDSWVKIKKVKTADCVIGGFTEGEGVRKQYFGALLLGVDHPLKYVGKVGTGFTDADLREIYRILREVETDENPFSEDVRGVHFVQPVYVCEVKYLEVTGDGRLRAPVFVRLRDDKEAEECTL